MQERSRLSVVSDRAVRRQIPHRLAECGYEMVGNPDRPKDGKWPIGDRRLIVYARRDLSRRDQILAARGLR